MPTKDEMVCVIESTGTPLPATATLTQIRKLYEEIAGAREEINPTETKIAVSSGVAKIVSGSATKQQATASSEVAAIFFQDDADASGSHASVPAATDAATMDCNALKERIRQLEMEKKILELEKEMAEIKASASAGAVAINTAQTYNSLRDVLECAESMIVPFSGDTMESVSVWFEEMERATSILQLHETTKLIVTRRLLVGTAAAFVKTLQVQSYNELKEQLHQAFGTGPTLECVYQELRSRHLLPSETTFRYVLDMEKIAKKGSIPEEEVVTIIIDNMGDASNTSAMRYAANTIEELKKLLGKYEQVRMTTLRSRYTPRPSVPSNPVVQQQSSDSRCYNCSAFGHFRDKCPKPRRPPGSCFHCHQLDHIYKNCPNRNKTPAAAIFTTDTEGLKLQETQEGVQQALSTNPWSQDLH